MHDWTLSVLFFFYIFNVFLYLKEINNAIICACAIKWPVRLSVCACVRAVIRVIGKWECSSCRNSEERELLETFDRICRKLPFKISSATFNYLNARRRMNRPKEFQMGWTVFCVMSTLLLSASLIGESSNILATTHPCWGHNYWLTCY
jgi:hypothetical protein